jgi:hypothetical protein
MDVKKAANITILECESKEQLFGKMPGMANIMGPMFDEMYKDSSVILRMRVEMYMPVLAVLAKQMAKGQALPAIGSSDDGNQPANGSPASAAAPRSPRSGRHQAMDVEKWLRWRPHHFGRNLAYPIILADRAKTTRRVDQAPPSPASRQGRAQAEL